MSADFWPPASKPRIRLPAGACDCHCHVFGPYHQFALAKELTYAPPEATPQAYLSMLDSLGFARGVLVQPSAHGVDNGALLAALRAGGNRLRGVAVVGGDTTFGELAALHAQGVRGLRFSRLQDENGVARYKNAVDISAMDRLLPAMRDLGMHAQLWIDAKQLPELAPKIRNAGVPCVIDHLGRYDPLLGLEYPGFKTLRELVEQGQLWVKLTPYRTSLQYPDHDDMRAAHEELLRIGEDHLIWGSDWPHINMPQDMPDAGHLIDLLASWTSPSALHKILVTNPAKLYGFSASAE